MKAFLEQINKNDIVLPDWNFKNIDAMSFKKLKQSIKKNGQNKTIILRKIDDKYEVIDGRNVFTILKTTKVDYIWAYVYKEITTTEAKFIYLQHDFFFERNFVEVAKALKKINKKHSKFDIIQTTNYNSNEIDELLRLTEFDFDKYILKETEQQNLL